MRLSEERFDFINRQILTQLRHYVGALVGGQLTGDDADAGALSSLCKLFETATRAGLDRTADGAKRRGRVGGRGCDGEHRLLVGPRHASRGRGGRATRLTLSRLLGNVGLTGLLRHRI